MNRLGAESSPYLRQHADNPVDWHPWGDEAFELARTRDVPVLLSVGYSACHWCHVMAHESFEDDDVAAVMNEWFVSVKVDREERPDVDAIYMEATMAMTGAGGWPMTVFLTPDRRPFFAGTYFPKTSGYGRPGFVDLLKAVHDAWATRRGDLDEQADQLTEAVRARSAVEPAADGVAVAVGPGILRRTAEALMGAYDREWGGFGRAPKFPMTSNVELLLRVFSHDHDERLLEAVVTTLDAMASGGIYDHVGGGFARYSVDAFWMVPHFEKMLYDNALIPRAYLHAWQVTDEERYRQVVEETIEYVRRDLGGPDGSLFSAEDADSEGEEGRFYVWRPEEIRAAGADAAIEWYGVTAAGNFEGANILHRPVRGDLLRPPAVEQARRALFEARARRVRPGLDDKVVTEWNAMFTAGHDAEALLVRTKDVYDGATPSANSVTALALARLGALTGHRPYADASQGVLRLLHTYLERQPTAVTVALATVDLVVTGPTESVVGGDRPDLVRAVQRRYLPTAVLAWGEAYASPLWEGRDRPAAYVCRDFVCGLPADSVEDLIEQIGSGTSPGR